MSTLSAPQTQSEIELKNYAGLCLHPYKEKELLYQKAIEKKSFKTLLSYPCLLFRWQRFFPEDRLRIAKIASHTLNNHLYCKSSTECAIVETFLKSQEVGQKELVLEEIPIEISARQVS